MPTLRIVRVQDSRPDAYDEHVAVISLDEERLGEVPLDGSSDFEVPAGEHEVGVRLGMNWGTKKVMITLAEGGIVTVTCRKARSAQDLRNIVHPSDYWSLDVT